MVEKSASLGLAVVLGLLVGALPARAWEVYRNDEHDLRIQLDTTLSVGVSLRTEEQDPDLIWVGHGGTNTNAASINNDDGNLNYDEWDVYSLLTKGTSELEIRWGDYAGFFRATAFWDPIANCSNRGRGAPPPATGPEGFNEPGCTRRSVLDEDARHRANRFEGGVVGAHFQLLDAYLEGSWDVFERPLNLRVGNQLISWGEGFFYQGINQINPVDVTKLRVPGSEIKEALLPSPMIRLQGELFGNLGIDAYYQFKWNPTYLDPTGSYFSTNDLLGRGASLPADGEGDRQGLFLPNVPGLLAGGGLAALLGPADPGATGLAPEDLFADCGMGPLSVICRGVPRVSTDEPSDQGQGGVALRYFFEQSQTELAAYYVHYHSKAPVVGFDAVSIPALLQNIPLSYFKQYPDDINLVGLSFATQVLSSAVAGEISYRPDDPVPLNALITSTPQSIDPTSPTRLRGFEREHRLQFILNVLMSIARGTRWIGPVVDWIGANDISFVAEWGLVLYPGLDDRCTPLGDTGAPPVPQIQPGCTPYAGPSGTTKQVNDVSWGYQLRIGPNWFNPFGLPIRFQPFVSWSHDVDGVTPGLNPFIEQRKAVNVGADIIYLDTWTGRVSYANFFDGGSRNLLNDRDFLSFSLSYAF